MTGANGNNYMVLQSLKLFHSKVSAGFACLYSQDSYNFNKFQIIAGVELSGEKNKCFTGGRFHISVSHI